MQIPENERHFLKGIRYAVTWLHDRAEEMNDPWAKAVLNVAADGLGKDSRSNAVEVKAKLLEIQLAKAAELPVNASSTTETGAK